MADIGRRLLGKNEIWWLRKGPGSHGDSAKSAQAVVEALAGTFLFAEEGSDRPGLRRPQLGALHAILAQRSMETPEPVTIVMPTGTGKTETMLAAFSYAPQRTLVVVPSDSLRTQISEKFVTLGILPTVGAVGGQFLTPVVAVLKSALHTVDECNELIEASNVTVATAAALSGCSEVARARLVELCESLYVDEAHHVAAKTWRSVTDLFSPKPIIQFTATPFREDGQHMGGRMAYAYPLRLAQAHGYFATINYRSVTDLGDVDRTIAEAAIAQLRSDIAAGRNHILMARVQSIPRANRVLAIYSELAADLNPVRIDSKLTERKQREAQVKIRDGTSRVVVCVDMLGEGFDLPALKVAAIHDPHKSLAVTLQFVGRFARVGGDDLGEASVFVPRHAGDVDDRLRRLYGEDADWNALIRDLTQAEIDREREQDEFESSFGAVPVEVAMRSIQPKMSTVVYQSDTLGWHPNAVYDLFGEENLLTRQIGINERDHVVWFVTAESAPVPWGDFSTFGELVHHLYVVHCDLAAGLLFVNSSNNDGVHEALAKSIGGAGTTIIRGDVVYRVLAGIARRVPTNVGLLDAVNRNRRFSMHVGADVLEGFGPGAAQKSKTNIFAHGYSNGSRVSFGASRKGRIWSHRAANSVLEWVNWAKTVGVAVTDESISIASVMEGFIIPTAATERPPLVPLGIEWPYSVVGNTSESRMVGINGVEFPLLDLDLAIIDPGVEGPIKFEVQSDAWRAAYEMTFGEMGPLVTSTGEDCIVAVPRGTQRLSEFMNLKGMSVFFEQEAVLSPDGYIIQPDRSRPRYDSALLEVVDWSDVNIRKEAQTANLDSDSVQFRTIETLSSEADWEVVIDDDGKGEIADIVMLRREEGVLEVLLAHCKYSSSDTPGARLGDLYEVCGQAVKSHKARSEIELILRKLIRREKRRQTNGKTGFIEGAGTDLLSILHESRMLDIRVTVVIAQPGLSKTALNVPISELLGCTELYLNETYNSRFRVLCSA